MAELSPDEQSRVIDAVQKHLGNPDVVVLKVEKAQQCDYCGTIAELRPYGRNGAAICHPCAMKPENYETTKAMFEGRMNGVLPHGLDRKAKLRSRQ